MYSLLLWLSGILLPWLALYLTSCTPSAPPATGRTQVFNQDFLEPDGLDLNLYHLVIDKSDYSLTLYYDTVRVKRYPVVLGGNPEDDKRMEGDKCTPEGLFGIRDKYPHDRWSRFIWIDYPNEESWAKHKASMEAGEIPEDASIGGEIGIHGVPEGSDMLIEEGVNWTLGCISLKNADVNEIYDLLGPKSTILIQK